MSIGGLTRLNHLELEGNNLRNIPREIGTLASLEILNLNENELESLPAELSNLRHLRSLSLDRNQLSELPISISSLSELLRLDLDNNKLSSLPPNFSRLANLQYLYLNGNRFSEFPSVVIELPKLRSLMLGNNKLASIPHSISQMKTLRSLFLAANSISYVPPEIGAFQNLETLNLSYNNLTRLPNELGLLASLERAAKIENAGLNLSLPKTCGLSLESNPLPRPYPTLIALGQPRCTETVLAWLRGEFDPDSLTPSEEANDGVPRLPSPPEPDEEAGPTFHLVDGRVDLLPKYEKSNDFDGTIQVALHARLRRQVSLLDQMTTKVGNQHPQLVTVVNEYTKLVQPSLAELDVVDLWAAGNALMAQANSFQHQDKTRTISEPLEPAHLGLLAEVAALHGSFILGFPTAAQLTSRADRSRVSPEILRTIGPPTSNVLSALSRQRRLLSERARQLIEALDASLLTGSWDAARIGYTSYATVRNALVAIGRICIWINDKGGSLAGGLVVAQAIAAANLPPDTLQLVMLFLKSNSADILSFVAPFPELRVYVEWIINHFDGLEAASKNPRKDNLDKPH